MGDGASVRLVPHDWVVLDRVLCCYPDLDRLLPKILDKAFERVGADRGVILLRDKAGTLVPQYVKTKSGKSDPNIVL